MRILDIIEKKRDKHELTEEEINFFIQEYTHGNVADYQASAWAMAVLLNGMSHQEISNLTMAMVNSGDTLDLSPVLTIAVDKHSTGGVGDKTTLVVEPVVAACGLPVGKMSGRGLGYTGGTLDKMESIPGYRIDLSTEEFIQQIKEVGMVLTGQTADLAPADGKLYALRDVTGTVPSIPLIASSIMSKKIAAGAQRIVMDVKIGSGAFMQTLADAHELAEVMVKSAELAGRKAVALLSDMSQPLGRAVGNSLEVIEAIDTLKGAGPVDFVEHCLEVAAYMLTLGEIAADTVAGRVLAEKALKDGSGFAMFRKLVIAQEGDVSYIDQPEKFPKAPIVQKVVSPESGYLREINARVVGEAAVVLGAGRQKKGEPIDHRVGLMIYHNVGDQVEQGQVLFEVHAQDQASADEAAKVVLQAHKFSAVPVKAPPLFFGVVS